MKNLINENLNRYEKEPKLTEVPVGNLSVKGKGSFYSSDLLS